MSGTPPEPIAQGEIGKTPFAHVLLHLHHKALSGTLVLWPTAEGVKGQDRILLDEGWPVAGRLVERAAALDRGMLPLFARTAGPYAFYDVDLVGDDAPLKQRVDPLMVLAASLRGSARDDVVTSYLDALGADAHVRLKPGVDVKRYLLQPKEGAFLDVIRAAPATVQELLGQCELGPGMGKRLLYLLFVTRSLERFDPRASVPSAPRASVVAAIRATGRGAPPGAAVPTSAGGPPSADGPLDLPLPDMPLPEAPAASSAAGPSVSPGARQSAAGAAAQRSAPGAARSPAAPSIPPADRGGIARFKESTPVPGPAPAGLSRDGAAFWAEVTARCQAIETQTYYDMLGVARDVGTDGVRTAYFALAKKWHPDRAIGELAPLRPYVEQVFAHFTAAQDILSDEKKRGSYLKQVQEGGGTPVADRQVEAILWAAKEHQKAEILIKRRDYEGAAKILSVAIEAVSDEPDLLATYAWCVFNLPGSDARIAEMLTAVDRALTIEAKHDRAQYYRGMILQRAGKNAEAVSAFRKAIELNPKNGDALREVRLAEMRGKSGPAAKSSASKPGSDDKKGDGGLLSKLFGSNKKS